LLNRLKANFEQENISVAIGYSMRHPSSGLHFAAEQADKKCMRISKKLNQL
jgi:hypothetical protein